MTQKEGESGKKKRRADIISAVITVAGLAAIGYSFFELVDKNDVWFTFLIIGLVIISVATFIRKFF